MRKYAIVALGVKACVTVLAIFLAIGNAVAQNPSLPAIRQSGPLFVDANGKQVRLRGVNLGNWLLIELWMTGIRQQAGVHDQYTIERTLEKRFGKEEGQRLMSLYRDNYITERDFQIIKSFGMNLVRIPFPYDLLEADDQPFKLRKNAWKHLDFAVNTAEKYGIYTVLDMHGAPGRQSERDHTGRSGLNRLWDHADSELNQKRTVWLWKQIATRYKDRGCVFAYDLLNEPWGSSQENLKQLVQRLYRAIREVDKQHIIILPGHRPGIALYGDPRELGMQNVTFGMHFYPGLYGWGQPTVSVHRDFLTKGLYEWDIRLRNLQTPMFVGECNVVFQSAGGAQMMRHTFDAYNKLGWAATMWSYKVFSRDGGIGPNAWSMTTNAGNPLKMPLLRLNTWAADNWNASFRQAAGKELVYECPGKDPVQMYLLIKTGASKDGTVNVVLDELSLVDDTGRNLIRNGSFGSQESWQKWTQTGELRYDFNSSQDNPPGAAGPALRILGKGYVNGGIYQELTLHGGKRYTLSGVSKDIGAKSCWLEVYLCDKKPVAGQDCPILPPTPDFLRWSKAEIADYFHSLSTMKYSINEDLRKWLTTDTRPGLFEDLPPRKLVPSSPFHGKAAAIPGTIQAEDFDLGDNLDSYLDFSYGNSGDSKARPNCNVDLEACKEGGTNLSFVSDGEWLAYTVDVKKTAAYTVLIRAACKDGTGLMHLEFAGKDLTGPIKIPKTGGWQAWQTITIPGLKLSQGRQQMKVVFDKGGWNLNWFEFRPE